MLKVLLADDDSNVSKCLLQLIDWDSLGYEVVGEAFDGDDAYRQALGKKPDVIISDIKMPYSDGTELCKKIRETMHNVEIIFLSAYEDFSAAQLALKYGVKEYILKPIDMGKIKMLSEVLSQIKANVDKKNRFEALLSSNDTDTGILNALKNNDLQYFKEFFDALIDRSGGDFVIVRALCLKLINILYDYFQLIGVGEDVVNKKRQGIEDGLRDLKMVNDLVFYTRMLYFNVMQFECDSNDYHVALIADIKKYINENYSEESFGVSSVAEKFHFSSDYLGKLFKQFTGTLISKYITDVRIEKAAALLRDTMLPVSDISSMVGYVSCGYFTKVFKAKENMTPSEYRIKSKLDVYKFSEI